jgi:DNA-binding NarL/FixJ family response regulator
VHGEFDPSELLRAVRVVAAGHGWLSPVAAAAAAATVRDQVTYEQAQAAEARRLQRLQAHYGITDREEEVLALLAEGLSNAAIAGRLVLTEKTVKNHLNHIFTKLQVNNRMQAILRWSGH